MFKRTVTILAGLVALLSATGACQQPAGATVDRLLIGEVMMHSTLAENLRAICIPGGRISGSPNGHRAERLVADKCRAYGLRNVHLEPFEMTSWYDRETTVTVLDDPPCTLPEATALVNTLSTPPDGITAELVDVGEGTPEDFAAHDGDISGKLVLARDRGPRRREKMSTALEYGAAGLVVMAKPDGELVVGSCHAEPRPEPAVVIRGEDGQELAERLAAGETVRLNIRIDAESWRATPHNVIAEIPGSGPLAREVVILSAHLDSWHLAEGALDNGIGSAAILEAARALTAVDWQPRRTVRFVWFMGEEHGLFGSQAYVRDHAAELDDIVAVVNIDMPGAPRSLVTFGHPEALGFLDTFREQMAGYEFSTKNSDAKGMFSDHAPFMQQGVCTFVLWGELGPGVKYYHSTGDKYDQVDRPATVQSAAVAAVLVRQLADAAQRPSAHLPAKEPDGEAEG